MWIGVDPTFTLILEFDIMWRWEVNYTPQRFTTGGKIIDIYKMGG